MFSSWGTGCMQECARYLETLKSYETKPADLIQGRVEEDYMSKLNATFTTVRGINKTDVLTLAGAFKTAAGVLQAGMQELSALPGIGPTKVPVPSCSKPCHSSRLLPAANKLMPSVEGPQCEHVSTSADSPQGHAQV